MSRAIVDEFATAVAMEGRVGCIDSSCRFGRSMGQHTNGGCRCFGRTMSGFEAIPPAELRALVLGLTQMVRLMSEEIAMRRPDSRGGR